MKQPFINGCLGFQAYIGRDLQAFSDVYFLILFLLFCQQYGEVNPTNTIDPLIHPGGGGFLVFFPWEGDDS